MTVASGIDAHTVLAALAEAEITHVVLVPDTHQKTVLDLLDDSGLPEIRCATEDDVLGVCAGLWMSGARPLAMIQQLGIFAAVNALRAFTHDQRVPLAILAGMYGRDVALSTDDDPASAVRLCIPLLDVLGVAWRLVESPDAAHEIASGLSAAFDDGVSSAVLLGAPTC